jgi:hypothetical protein
MTDKAYKIEKWIKEKIACWCNESQCEVPELPKQIIEGKILALREMLSFIDSLQEEPKFKIGDVIRFKGNETLEGEEETHKIVGYDNELYIFDDGTTDLFCEQELYELVKEPVSEEFEEALAREWQGYNDRGAATVDALEDNAQELTFAKGFYRGWNYPKQLPVNEDFEKTFISMVHTTHENCGSYSLHEYAQRLYNIAKDTLREPVSEDLEAEIERINKNNHFDFSDWKAIARHFANWQKEQMMKNSVECTVHADAGGYPYIGNIELYDYENDKPLAKAGDKVKVIINN